VLGSNHIFSDLRLYRAGVALAILLAHAAALYALTSLGAVVSRSFDAPLAARFIEVPQPTEQWQPRVTIPPVVQVTPPQLIAPEIEVPIEPATPSNAITAVKLASATPPPPMQGQTAKLISSVEYVRQPAPRYPPQSRRLREEGLVVLRVMIDEKGQACHIEVETSSGHARLDHAAKEAVARAEFRPYIEDGEPRRALVLIPIEFSLSSRA